MRKQIWVGIAAGAIREVFRSDATPTVASHGAKYVYCIGPFRTVRGANWMADPMKGRDNPHCRNTRDAEKLAKKYA